jgi:hypothetical protein
MQAEALTQETPLGVVSRPVGTAIACTVADPGSRTSPVASLAWTVAADPTAAQAVDEMQETPLKAEKAAGDGLGRNDHLVPCSDIAVDSCNLCGWSASSPTASQSTVDAVWQETDSSSSVAVPG